MGLLREETQEAKGLLTYSFLNHPQVKLPLEFGLLYAAEAKILPQILMREFWRGINVQPLAAEV
jgi:hypothetical protein